MKGGSSKLLGGSFNFDASVREVIRFKLGLRATSRVTNDKDDMIGTILDMRPDYPAYLEDGSINMISYYVENPLFTLDNHTYTGADFKRFAASYPRSLKMQLEAFTVKSVLDYENSRLEEKYPAFRLLMQEYKEGMLLFEISNREVWERAVADEAGQAAYFTSHKSDYNYKEPRYKGVVVHCADKKMAKEIKKLIKKLPEKVWADTIAKTYNDSVAEIVKVEEGLFAKGDNKYVDKLVFKTGSFEPLESYPFTAVFGEKRKGPDSYTEVRGPLAADYQNFLESLWVKRLRDESKVEINQEVLKTVNNH